MSTTLLITGASGFIGSHLINTLLADDVAIVGLTRDKLSASKNEPRIIWVSSVDEIGEDKLDVVINLTGASLAEKRWSRSRKQEVRKSRISFTQNLLDALFQRNLMPSLLLNASAIGIYGSHADEVLDEGGSHTDSFSHQLCKDWESEARKFSEHSTEVSCLRLGVVLGKSGALPELVQSFRLKVKTMMGSGKPYFSWIHIDDVGQAIKYLLEKKQKGDVLAPVYNMTAPEPVTYKALSDAIAKVYRPWVSLPMPASVMKILLGEMAEELLLTGQRVVPAQLAQDGYVFKYKDLDAALAALLPL